MNEKIFTVENTESEEAYIKSIQTYFAENKYIVIRKFLDENMAGLLYQYCITNAVRVDFLEQHAKDSYRPAWDGQFGDEQAKQSFNRYGDPLMDTMLVASTRNLEKYTGLSLIPNYTYWRLYVQGEDLKRHTDRDSCEISTTLCLGYNTSNVDLEKNPDYDWPMWVETNDNPEGVPLHLKPGDLIIYRGCEVDHWRDNFIGLNHAQMFMHYNDQSGPYKIALDGRPIIGIPKTYQAKR
jgi:hypothetical protein